jgi:hypothetical protein
MTSNRSFLILISLISFLPFVRAQVPQEGLFSFRTLGAGVVIEDLFYSSEGKVIPVPVSTETRSVYHTYKGPHDKLVFFRQIPGPDGKQIQQNVASVNLAGAGNRPLLIFLKHPTEAGLYEVRPFSDSSKDVPPGGYRFVNFTIRKIAIVMGQQKLLIPPGGQVIAKGEVGNSTQSTAVQVFGVVLNDEVRAIYSNMWAYNPNNRSIVLIAPSLENATGAKVKCISENINQIPIDPEPIAAKSTTP